LLFYDTVSVEQICGIISKVGNEYELKRIWMEVAVAYFKGLCQYLPEGPTEYHETPIIDTLCADNQTWDLLNIKLKY
jgi:hypothetical protein